MCNDFLYRFIPAPGTVDRYNTSLKCLVQHNKVKVSNPSRLNDPFDCKTLYSTSDATIEDFGVFFNSVPLNLSAAEKESISISIQSSPVRAAENLRSQYMQYHNEDLDNYRILCYFEPRETEYPVDELMWAHYAQSHRGLCLQFRKNILTDSFICKPVNYEDRYPSFREIAANNAEGLAELIFFRKSTRWAYENEWRLLCDKTDIMDGNLQLPAAALTGVIFGCEAEYLECEKVARWAQQRSGPALNFFNAKKHSEKYQIIIESLG